MLRSVNFKRVIQTLINWKFFVTLVQDIICSRFSKNNNITPQLPFACMIISPLSELIIRNGFMFYYYFPSFVG